MTADTFGTVEAGPAVLVQGDGLVASVRAGDHAPAAADASFVVESGEEDGVPLQDVRRLTHRIQSQADDLLRAPKSDRKSVV